MTRRASVEGSKQQLGTKKGSYKECGLILAIVQRGEMRRQDAVGTAMGVNLRTRLWRMAAHRTFAHLTAKLRPWPRPGIVSIKKPASIRTLWGWMHWFNGCDRSWVSAVTPIDVGGATGRVSWGLKEMHESCIIKCLWIICFVFTNEPWLC